MVRPIAFVLLDLEVLREESAPEIFKIHLRRLPVLLGRQLLLGGGGWDLEHVLPRNELLDILQGHGFDAKALDNSTREEVLPCNETLAIRVHRRVGPARVTIGTLKQRPQRRLEVVQEMFPA